MLTFTHKEMVQFLVKNGYEIKDIQVDVKFIEMTGKRNIKGVFLNNAPFACPRDVEKEPLPTWIQSAFQKVLKEKILSL